MQIYATTPSAKFLSKVPAGIDIKNTVKALLARYYNMHSMATGTYNGCSGNKAITNAQAASLTVKSEFRFTCNNYQSIRGIKFYTKCIMVQLILL